MKEGGDPFGTDFQRARLRGFVHAIGSALSGHSRELLAFDEVREKLHLGGPVYRGVQAVPLDKIRGSVNRYRDFDRLFLPTQSHTADRWRKVNRAWYQEISLPPVILYKVGEVYFVVDGNHRVSVARDRGQTYIDAEVREVAARVPVTSDLRPEDLVRLGARVEFLERTEIDRLLPKARIEPTILGGYDRLIEHIAVHRYFLALERGQPVSSDEAVAHWYESLYLPVVEVIERSGILRELPGRTATDMYLWTMDHLHYLRSEKGLLEVTPASAAADLIESIDEDDS
ncbi:MAG TPA: hypothetical protein VLL77_12255 [Anaerolineales bacterium]|nr:hypothetical protein [Anaerolineales bacterium]